MKRCFKCGQEKQRTEFYPHPQMGDGLLGKCKECAKKDVHANRWAKIDKYREYDRARGARQSKEYKTKYKTNNPIPIGARTIVGNAVRDGRLTKPDACEQCAQPHWRLHGHHDDYAFPLTVRWLCPACHKQWHRDNGRGKNA